MTYLRFIILFLMCTNLLIADGTNELYQPNNTVTDFTFNSTDSSSSPSENEYETSIDKITYELEKVIGLFPRQFTTSQCQNDINGIEYCPQSLAECGQSWDYENGYSVSGVGTVADYTAKVGTSVPAVGSTNTIELYTGHSDVNLQIRTYSNGKIELYSFFLDDWYFGSGRWVLKSSAPSLDAQPNYINKSFYVSPSYIGNNKFCFDTKSSVQCLTVGVPNIVHLGKGQEVINITSNTDGTFTYRYHNVYNEPPDHSKNFRLGLTCTDGSTPVNGMCTTYSCPSGYSDNGTNCKKNVNYTYYNYLCSSGYTATNAGGNTGKTDPNTSTDNTSTLDDPLNSSTPPVNNCKKEKFTCLANESRPCALVDNKMQCSPYACNGEHKCSVGVCTGAEPNQTLVMPSELLPIKPINKSAGSCQTSTCLQEYEYNDGTATKVNVTHASGNYYYYTYTCPTGANTYGQSWELTKTNTNPGCIVDSITNKCTNFEKENSVCKRKIFNCPISGGTTCQLNTSVKQFQCTEQNCTGTQGVCNGTVCDVATYNQITYCSNQACPNVAGVYTEGGHCYVDACPVGTIEDPNDSAQCIQEN